MTEATLKNPTVESATTLKTSWTNLKAEHPKLRIRDAAHKLGVSEVELLVTECGENVTRLEANWGELIQELPTLGEVMALTRNADVVHEKIGAYDKVSIFGKMGVVLNHHIDLRLFLKHWHSGFAVQTESRGKTMYSLQFFDCDGTAVHKVFLTEQSNAAAYDALVHRYRSENQSPSQMTFPLSAPVAPTPEDQIDVEFFQTEWDALRDTHDFIKLLQEFNVARLQAFRLAGPTRAYPVSPTSVRQMLETVQQNGCEIMVFVGSPGVIQIHTGPVKRLIVMEPWLNVMDPDFNLHFREDAVAQCWVVLKPTVDGVVTSLETFNAEEQNTAMFFGKRKPGEPELAAWRDVIAQLPKQKG